MRFPLPLAGFMFVLGGLFVLVPAQSKSEENTNSVGIKLDKTVKQRWRIGVIVTAGDGAASGLIATTPVPMDWPEQQVKMIDRNVSANVRRISYRTLAGGVKQMIVSVPRLAARESATAVMTFEISKRFISEPEDSTVFAIPKTPSSKVRKYLSPSPYIDSRNAKVRLLAKQVIENRGTSWDQVGAIFDWVRENVKYRQSDAIKTSVQALEDGVGDCEELTSLFIAMCRANRIPARAVWVPGHCYPEFYLHDKDGKGHWIPCQAAGGNRDFGRMPEPRPILQKGDNFRVEGHPKPLRYVRPTLTARDAAANPEMKWVVEMVSEENPREK